MKTINTSSVTTISYILKNQRTKYRTNTRTNTFIPLGSWLYIYGYIYHQMTEQHHTLTERMRILAQGTKYDSCNQSVVYHALGEILIQLKTWFNCMRVLNYRILLRKEAEGGYTVLVPSLPGCITYGDTIEEAIEMAKEAIELYIESLKEHGDEIPTEEGMLEYTLAVEAHA